MDPDTSFSARPARLISTGEKRPVVMFVANRKPWGIPSRSLVRGTPMEKARPVVIWENSLATEEIVDPGQKSQNSFS